jgi:hypothetical protein
MTNTEYLMQAEVYINSNKSVRVRGVPLEDGRYPVMPLTPHALWEFTLMGANAKVIMIDCRRRRLAAKNVYPRNSRYNDLTYNLTGVIREFDPIDPFVTETTDLVALWRNIVNDQIQKFRAEIHGVVSLVDVTSEIWGKPTRKEIGT